MKRIINARINWLDLSNHNHNAHYLHDKRLTLSAIIKRVQSVAIQPHAPIIQPPPMGLSWNIGIKKAFSDIFDFSQPYTSKGFDWKQGLS